MSAEVVVVGGGLAGSEAAWQAARAGCRVRLWEMRPASSTPAHHTDRLAELVCTNSLKSEDDRSAPGQLKWELRRLGSVIMAAADATRVPAGQALAVDRDAFAAEVTAAVTGHPDIAVVRARVDRMPEARPAVVATGPLTAPALADALARVCGQALWFYDAAAPVVTAESVDRSYSFAASRYGKGEGTYVNCPLTRDQYRDLVTALATAETHRLHGFEDEDPHFFESCLPVEVLARRGEDALRFGPLKPVGLWDPKTGEQPYAVLQLRQDNAAGTLYNVVGFQTNLLWSEQRRVLGLVPALAHAEFVRYGVMHRNTYVCSPRCLDPRLAVRGERDLFLAGQITGVEGYLESTAMGLWAGLGAAAAARGSRLPPPPPTTAMGALVSYITTADADHFAPMNVAFGLFPPLPRPIRRRTLRQQALVDRARSDFTDWLSSWPVTAG